MADIGIESIKDMTIGEVIALTDKVLLWRIEDSQERKDKENAD